MNSYRNLGLFLSSLTYPAMYHFPFGFPSLIITCLIFEEYKSTDKPIRTNKYKRIARLKPHSQVSLLPPRRLNVFTKRFPAASFQVEDGLLCRRRMDTESPSLLWAVRETAHRQQYQSIRPEQVVCARVALCGEDDPGNSGLHWRVQIPSSRTLSHVFGDCGWCCQLLFFLHARLIEESEGFVS